MTRSDWICVLYFVMGMIVGVIVVIGWAKIL